MTAGRKLKKLKGVKNTTLVMGTDLNKSVLAEIGAQTPEVQAATSNTLIIALDTDRDGIEPEVEALLEKLLAGNGEKNADEDSKEYKSVDADFDAEKDANLVIISVSCEFAGEEARKALMHDANVYFFSTNIPMRDEIELKQIAREKGLNRSVLYGQHKKPPNGFRSEILPLFFYCTFFIAKVFPSSLTSGSVSLLAE